MGGFVGFLELMNFGESTARDVMDRGFGSCIADVCVDPCSTHGEAAMSMHLNLMECSRNHQPCCYGGVFAKLPISATRVSLVQVAGRSAIAQSPWCATSMVVALADTLRSGMFPVER